MTARRLVLILSLLGCSGSGPPASASLGSVASAAVTATTLTQPVPTGLVRSGIPRPAAGEMTRYEIDQAIDDVTGTFAGKLALRFVNRTGKALASLPLLLHPNAAEELGGAAGGSGSLRVTEVTSRNAAVVVARHEAVRPTLTLVHFAKPIAPGAEAKLLVRYQGRLRRLPPGTNDVFAQALRSIGSMSSGVGAADYGLLAMGDGIVTAASAYPMVAPPSGTGFDVSGASHIGDLAYNEIAGYRVRTIVPAGVSVVTNLADAPPVARSDGGTLVVSEGEAVRDFVLVAGRDLERSKKQVGEVTVTSVYRRRDRLGGGLVLDAAAASVASFARRFGPYPYRELDAVEASLVGGAGGVEFSGMVLIAGMLYRPADASQSPLATLMKLWGNLGARISGGLSPSPQKDAPAKKDPSAQQVDSALRGTLEFTVAHEVAHQYFAGIVGNDSHRSPSLDEPLAQYSAALVIEDLHGAKAAREAMDHNVKLNYALYRLLGGPDRPVLRDAASFRTSVEYAGLVYGKAPYAYVALRDQVGAERLHAAIRAVVKRYYFRIATTDEWIAALDAELPGAAVTATFERWFRQTHGDADLKVDDSGDFVLDAVFPPEVASTLRAALPAVGMKPAELLRMVFGGAIGDDAPVGPGINPVDALRGLEGIKP